MKLDGICRINVFGVAEHRMEMYHHQRRLFFFSEKRTPVRLHILASRVTSLLMSWIKQDVDFVAPAQSTPILFDMMFNTPPQVYGFVCTDLTAFDDRNGSVLGKKALWISLSHVAFEQRVRGIFAHNQGHGGDQSKPDEKKSGKRDQPDKSKREGDKGSQRVKKLKKIKGFAPPSFV